LKTRTKKCFNCKEEFAPFNTLQKFCLKNECIKAMVVYERLEKEFRTARQINFDLQHINLELKQEVKDLKKIIEFNNADL